MSFTFPSSFASLKERRQGALQVLRHNIIHGLCVKCAIIAHAHVTCTSGNMLNVFKNVENRCFFQTL